MKALLTLRPPESKQLIARAVVHREEVQAALDEGLLVVGAGSTNAAVAQHCTKTPVDPARFLAGMVIRGTLCVTPREQRLPNLVLVKGEPVDTAPKEALDLEVTPKVLIKGANAVDPAGNCGVLMAAPDGGTVGRLLGPFLSAGWPVITPVGLEKLIPSVPEAVKELGRWVLDRSLGAKVGMMPLLRTTVITEIQALHALAGVTAIQVAAGGICDSEGSVTLTVEGPTQKVEAALALVEEVKGAETPWPPLNDCETCKLMCDYRGRKNENRPKNLQK